MCDLFHRMSDIEDNDQDEAYDAGAGPGRQVCVGI